MKNERIIIVVVVSISILMGTIALFGAYNARNKNIPSRNEPFASSTPSDSQTEVTLATFMPHEEQTIYPCPPQTVGGFLPPPCLTDVTPIHEITQTTRVAVAAPSWDSPPFPLSATTSQFIGRGGVTGPTKLTPSDVLIAYNGDVLIYHNTTMGFAFGLPSIGKELRMNDTGIYTRRSDALVWLWFTKSYDIATANFFVTPSEEASLSTLSFNYNFIGYPTFTGKLSSTMTIIDDTPTLVETVSYESSSPNYPNTWKFIHILRNSNLYTFGVQIAPSQAVNVAEAEQMLHVFSNSFRFLPLTQ